MTSFASNENKVEQISFLVYESKRASQDDVKERKRERERERACRERGRERVTVVYDMGQRGSGNSRR